MSLENPFTGAGDRHSLREKDIELAARAAQRLRVADEEARRQLAVRGAIDEDADYDLEFMVGGKISPESIELRHTILMAAAIGPHTADIRDRVPITRFFFLDMPYRTALEAGVDKVIRRVTRLNDFVAVVEDTYLGNDREPMRYDPSIKVSAAQIEETRGSEVPNPY